MNMMNRRFDVVDKATFHNGMSRLGSAVSVVATCSRGKNYGFTASAVCGVSDTPPTLLVCINRASSCFHAFENTSLPGQEDIPNHFGGKILKKDRFAIGDWGDGLTGAPVLTNASVSFECELTNAVNQATHRILFGRVIDIRQNAEQATLLYCMRRYLSG